MELSNINKVSLVQVSSCSNTGSIRDDRYWTSRKTFFELIELSSINRISFFLIKFNDITYCKFLIFQLIGGLVDEKGRWQESVTEFDGQIINVVGDVMISSGIIAYLGSFTVSRTSRTVPWVANKQTTIL